MPHLNDPKLAAQLLSGISFTINHTSRGGLLPATR